MADDAIRAYAAARRFGAATLERWLGLTPAARAALLALAERCRLGENQFRDVLDDLVDIAVRRDADPSAVLEDPAIAALWRRGLGRNQAIKALKDVLRGLRHPQRTAIEARLAALARSLRLPAGAQLTWPPGLEGEQLTLTLRAGSVAELRAQAAAVAAVAGDAAVDEMFALLEGRW